MARRWQEGAVKTLTILLALLLAPLKVAQASQPIPGDSWVYHSIYRANGSYDIKLIEDTVKVVVDGRNTLGKPRFKGLDTFGMHSETCLFDVFVGNEIPGAIACDDPLPIGKTWYAGPIDIYQGPKQWFTITGREKITLEGATYLATIISTVGPLPGHSGYRRSTYWYAPEIKGMMKVIHEGLEENGVVTVEEIYTLQSFRLAED
jgi:hypothetical protein